MIGMMQQMGALPIVGPGAVAAGGDPTWGPTAVELGRRRLVRREPRDPEPLRRGDGGRRRRRGRRARRRGRRSSTTAPAGARATSTRCSTCSATLRAAMPDLQLRARHDVHGQRGQPGRRALRRARHAHGRGALRRRALRQGDRLDAQRLPPHRATARSSSAGRRRTCSRCSSRPACSAMAAELPARASSVVPETYAEIDLRADPELRTPRKFLSHEAERGDPWPTPRTSPLTTRRTSGTGSSPPTTRPRSPTRRSSRGTSTRRTSWIWTRSTATSPRTTSRTSRSPGRSPASRA